MLYGHNLRRMHFQPDIKFFPVENHTVLHNIRKNHYMCVFMVIELRFIVGKSENENKREIQR